MSRFIVFRRSVVFVLFSLVLLSSLSLAVQRDFTRNRDLHQFVSAGKLLTDRGLLPYQDYPYFHLPNLVFIYAGLFEFTSYLTLAANLFSVACAVIMMGALFMYFCSFVPDNQPFSRLLLAVGTIIALMTNHTFTYTTGWSWNHELSTLLAVLAFICHCHAAKHARLYSWFFLSGLLVGLSTGTRATGVFLFPAFAASFVWMVNCSLRQKMSRMLVFFGAFSFSLLPSFYLFLSAPQNFIFGNFVFRKLVVQMWSDQNLYPQIPDFLYWTLKKIHSLVQVMVVSPNVTILVILVVCFFPLQKRCEESRWTFRSIFCLALFGCSLIGVLLTTPTFEQYYYPVIVFGLALAADRLAMLLRLRLLTPLRTWVLIACVVVSTIAGFLGTDYKNLLTVFSPEAWRPVKIHQEARQIALIVGRGKVLTFTPILALEGGVDIYPEFANGVFAWETGYLMDKQYREKTRVVTAEDLPGFLESNRPRAIITGYEPVHDVSLIIYARKNGFHAQQISTNTVLWTASE